MQRLTSLSNEIRAVRNCASVQALLLDVWELALRDGEDAGLIHARNLLGGVRAWVAERDRMARLRGSAEAGAVLGAAPLPAGRKGWWALLEGGDVVPGDDRRATEAVYWCESSAGWWRVPVTA